MWSTTRKAIIDKLNSPEVTTIKEAHRTDVSKLGNYVVAVVTPSDREANYHSTHQDRIVYAFNIRIFYPFVFGQDEADIELEKALDELEQVFGDRDALGAACDWVEPIRGSRWMYAQRSSGWHRFAEFTVRCVVHR